MNRQNRAAGWVLHAIWIVCSSASLSLICNSGFAWDGRNATTETRKSSSTALSRSPFALDLSAEAIESRLKADVEFLASEELEGRGPRSKGLDLAADYIAEQFRQARLVADHYKGGAFHEFRLFSSSRRGVVESVQLTGSDGEMIEPALVRGTDYTSLASCPLGKFSLPIVFAGYGITAKELNYDDYENLDVRGKAVFILRHEPQQHMAESVFNGSAHSRHAYIRSKVENAKKHGAAAVILCTNHSEFHHPDDIVSPADADRKPGEDDRDPLLKGDLNGGDTTEGIPVIHVRRKFGESLFRRAFSKELEAVEQEIDETLQPQSGMMEGLTIQGEVQIVRSHRTYKNVVASLEGEGPLAEETIVVGAHYDHLGRDGWGSLSMTGRDEIHYGADDNASGTAVLMEVARQLSARPEPLKRRVLFIAFSVEELGLIGSKQYVQDPLIPIDQTIAMLNLDMVGRLRNGKLTVYGMETSSDWKPLVETTAQKSPGAAEFKLLLRPGGYGPSDHASFYEKGVPVLHFFTGFHDEYHRPTDVASLINTDGMRQISTFVSDLVVQIANQDDRPSKKNSGASDPLMASLLPREDDSADSGPRLGVQVQTRGEDPGVVVRLVVAESPAEKSGVKVGDIISHVDGIPVKSAADIRATLQKSTAPYEWKVRIRRGEIESEILVRSAL